MAYQTGTATGHADLLSKLSTFAQTNGWTEDRYNSGNQQLALSKGDCFVQFRWDGTNRITMNQSTGWAGGSAFNAQANQVEPAANFQITGSISQGRFLTSLGAGPFTSYHFFAQASPDCIYMVLESSAGLYHHLGFGHISKYGGWTGGAFLSHSHWNASSDADQYTSGNHNVMMDAGIGANTSQGATMRIEGMPNQVASGKWGKIGATSTSSSSGNDNAGIAREWIHGGVRGGFMSRNFTRYQTSQLQAFVPLIPISAFYMDRTTTPRRLHYLGDFPWIRTINIAAFEPQAEISLGADVWKVFPFRRKQQLVSNDTDQSGYGGLAYLK